MWCSPSVGAVQVDHLQRSHKVARLVIGQHTHEQLGRVVGVHVKAIDEPLETLVGRLEHEVGRHGEHESPQLGVELRVHGRRLNGALEVHARRAKQRRLERLERGAVYALELLEAVGGQAQHRLAVQVGGLARVIQKGDAAPVVRRQAERARLRHLESLELRAQRRHLG